MEPLPGWGSSPWSQAPTDNIFRLVLCVFLLNLLQRISAQPLCRQEEFSVGDECCPMCNPGYHVKQACSEYTGTVCAPCPPQTYTAHPNGLSKCLPCGVCDPDMGLLTWQECSSRKDTVCRCIPGHFCETQNGEHCSTCLPHTACPPGQRVQKRGTYNQDTVCADCLTGTYSLGGTQEECLPWTKCGAFQQEVTRGTSSTDTTCSFRVVYAVVFILLGLVIVGVGPTAFFIHKRRHLHSVKSPLTGVSRFPNSAKAGPVARELEPFQQEQQENTIRFPVTEVGLAATEEETASNCTNPG